eukprot:symbB.v1.2.014260.t4/scaffold1023.1/size143418/4
MSWSWEPFWAFLCLSSSALLATRWHMIPEEGPSTAMLTILSVVVFLAALPLRLWVSTILSCLAVLATFVSSWLNSQGQYDAGAGLCFLIFLLPIFWAYEKDQRQIVLQEAIRNLSPKPLAWTSVLGQGPLASSDHAHRVPSTRGKRGDVKVSVLRCRSDLRIDDCGPTELAFFGEDVSNRELLNFFKGEDRKAASHRESSFNLLFQWAFQQGKKPWLEVAYHRAMSSCGAAMMWTLAVHLLATMSTWSLERQVISYNRCMGVCRKAGQGLEAVKLLATMLDQTLETDVISFNTAISACERSSLWTLALDLFTRPITEREMSWFESEDPQLFPDVISYSSVISACDKGEEWSMALSLLRDTCSYADKSLEEVYRLAIPSSQALAILSHMTCADVISYSGSISACERSGQWEIALLLLTETPSPDVICFSSAISACEKNGHWQIALKILTEMEGHDSRPNVISFSGVISACEKGHHWSQALQLFDDMKSKQLEADRICFNSMISACDA